MNKQINPDHCYETEDGVSYMLEPVHGTPEWRVLKDGKRHQTFTSLMAAKGWLEHVLDDGEREPDPDEEYGSRADWLYERDR